MSAYIEHNTDRILNFLYVLIPKNSIRNHQFIISIHFNLQKISLIQYPRRIPKCRLGSGFEIFNSWNSWPSLVALIEIPSLFDWEISNVLSSKRALIAVTKNYVGLALYWINWHQIALIKVLEYDTKPIHVRIFKLVYILLPHFHFNK